MKQGGVGIVHSEKASVSLQADWLIRDFISNGFSVEILLGNVTP